VKRVVLAYALAGALGTAASDAADGTAAVPLRSDPFAMPELERPLAAGEHDRRSEPSAEWSPVLRGILIGDRASLVDLGGVVLRPGQETRGWRLLEVRLDEAVFARDGQSVVLPLAEAEPAREARR
jgi:hypothetical protein